MVRPAFAMNRQSEWRADLARQVSPIYAADSRVRAVMIAGSVGRGVADEYSDVEVGVFWSEAPSNDERRALAEGVGFVPPSSLSAFESRPDDPAGEEADEDIYVGGDRSSGFNVEIKHKTVDICERVLHEMFVDGVPHDDRLAEAVAHSIPLYGHDLLARWQAVIARYPAALATRVARERLRLSPWHLAEMFADEGDTMLLREQLSYTVGNLVCALGAVNRVFVMPDKWMAWSVERLDIAPPELLRRIHWVFALAPHAACREARALVEETFELVNTHLPDVGVEELRETAFEPGPRCVVRSGTSLDRLNPQCRDIVEHVAGAFAGRPAVMAVTLSGQFSLRRVSDYAAMEFCVVWESPPSDSSLQSAMSSVCGEWREAPRDPQAVSRCVEGEIEGVRVDILHTTVGDIDRASGDVGGDPATIAELRRLVDVVTHGAALHGHELVSRWRDACAASAATPEVSAALVAATVGGFGWAWSNRVDIYARREGSLFYY